MGNFLYTLIHIDCYVINNVHSDCDIECCNESACCETESDSLNITNERESCCEVHIETASNQDSPLPVISKFSEKLKSLSIISITESASFRPVNIKNQTGGYRTSDISLEISNLRI